MPYCSPQRFLANNRNAVRTATLTPSSVLPIDDGVLSVPTARNGTAQVALTGSYTGAEEASYDIEVVDSTVSTPLVSAPVLTGEGSGHLEDISSAGPAQAFTVELAESGVLLQAAGVDLEGVALKARTAGDVGNGIFISVDQTGLTFTPQSYSLLTELPAGAGGKDAPLKGAEFDYDTKILGADNQIPIDAHRISFGSDTSAIYLQYKKYLDGEWLYFFVPALKRAVPRGSVVSFVTGGRTVTVVGTGSPAEETYTGIVTLYDLLDALKTTSALVDVDGVVANDRSPTGQASQELQTRTDAHAEPSYGTGGDQSLGFEGVSVAASAGTQLVIATCRAVTARDHSLAGVGRERWELKSSTLGDLGTIVTAEPYAGAEFNLTVPRRLPYNYGTQKGRFSVTNISYVARADGANEPAPLCPVALTLGPEATDQTITLEYTKRPSGDCVCDSMPVPNVDTSCLGNTGLTGGGTSVSYQSDTIFRVTALRSWFTDTLRGQTSVALSTGVYVGTQDPVFSAPTPVLTGADALSLQAIVDRFETVAALMDPLTVGSPSLRGDGFAAWDGAVVELKADIAAFFATAGATPLSSIPSDRYTARLGQVLMTAGISPLGESDASTAESGDGCWRDWGDAYYWTVVGANGGYAPAFNNHPYWSSSRATAQDSYFSTHEFAFQINVKCPQDLLEGDTITLAIGNAGWPATYQIGDELILPIIAAQDLYLAGGKDASLVQLWYVTGTVSGPLPSFAYDPDSPTPYADGSPPLLAFTLIPGGIPFAKGDAFRFSVEGGHYRWRKNAAAWSASIAIPAGVVAFDAGLSVEFLTGAAPSFVALDTFSFLALQPWAVSNLTMPTVERWQWTGAAPSLVADLGSAQALDMAAIALHTLPVGATITLEGGTAAGIYTWTETLTRQTGVIAKLIAQTARYLRLTLGNATGGGIGWLWVGQALTQTLSANSLPRLVYKVNRGEGGLNQRGRYLGKGIGGDVEWTEAALSETDLDGIVALVDHVKENDDEPLIFLPQVTRPTDAFLVQILADEVDMPDLFDWQPDADHERRHSVKLPLQAVLQ